MKLQSSKHQEYTYTAQSVHSVGASSVVFEEAGFWVQPPENTISIERMFIDVFIQFDTHATLSDCKVIGVGMVTSTNYLTNQSVRKVIDTNFAADANYQLRIKMNLTSLLDKTKVSRDITDDDHNIPILVFPTAATPYYYDASLGFYVYGTPNIKWWKNDALYTTVGQV